MPNIWLLRANFGEHTQRCVDGGFHGLGWEMGDCSPIPDRARLTERWESVAPAEDSPRNRRAVVGIFARFLFEMQVGDWILTPEVNARWLRYGQITGNYWFEADALTNDTCHYQHRRTVDWKPDPIDRTALSVPFQNTLKSNLTLFKVRHEQEFLTHIGDPTSIPQKGKHQEPPMLPFELALERILILGPSEFEQLVGHLLAAMGFEIEVSQPVADGGVDFRGVLNVSNAAQVRITGQVKRYQRGSKITARPIRDLRGRIPIGDQGTFVTTSDYTKDARSVAEQDGFARVGLINGEQLVDLLTQHWPDIPTEFRDALGLKPILVPA